MSEPLQNPLRPQLDNAQMQIKNLAAQLEATKQMINESLTSSLQLRSSLVLMQQANQELGQKNAALTNELTNLKAPKDDAAAVAAAVPLPPKK